MSKQLIKDIRPGEEVKSIFFTQRKELRKTRRGDLYISLELADCSGSVAAKIWDQVAKYKDSFSEKEFVAVNGRAGMYQDQLQLEIKTIRRCREEEVDLEQFLRKSQANLVELEETLRLLVSELKAAEPARAARRLLEDEGFMERFRRAPAAKSYHHPYLGGLLEHTVSVALVCDKICEPLPRRRPRAAHLRRHPARRRQGQGAGVRPGHPLQRRGQIPGAPGAGRRDGAGAHPGPCRASRRSWRCVYATPS